MDQGTREEDEEPRNAIVVKGMYTYTFHEGTTRIRAVHTREMSRSSYTTVDAVM
jgi:hypothetical protein